MNTDELIKSIEDWKAKKDDIEYQKKIAEENKTYALLEQINNTITKEAKDILRLYKALLKCGVTYGTKSYSKPRFLFRENEPYLFYKFNYCGCKIFSCSEEICFCKLDSAAFPTNHVSNPPNSLELVKFMQAFDEFKKEFYNFIDETLKS